MRYGKNAVVLSSTMWLGAVLILISAHVCGQTSCEWGKYGENCDIDCPEHCIVNKDKQLQHCHKITGKCSEGCKHGWHGNQCNRSCSSHCLKNICNQQNGLCSFGCDGSYSGDFCNITSTTRVQTTLPTTLPTTEASSPEPATNLILIIVPIIIICLVIMTVVACLVWRRRRNANIDSRFPEEIPLMEVGAARPQHGVAEHNPESDSLGQKINNARALFVETESFKKVREMLETFHHVTISGAPGEGKTFMALMLGAEYRKRGYEVVLVEDLYKVRVSDWQGDGKDVCLIFDDIFQMVGPYLDVPRLTHLLYELHLLLSQCKNRPERRYESYQQESWEEGRGDTQTSVYLIFTSESTTLERAMSKLGGQIFRFFNSCTIADLTRRESLAYIDQEKIAIWQKHKSHYSSKLNVNPVAFSGSDNKKIGFPLVCRLLSNYAFSKDSHENLLENPVSTLKVELHKVISRRNDLSAALILVLLCDGQLNIVQLENKSDPDLETHLQALLTIVQANRQDVAKAVRSLSGSLLTEGNVTTFSHSLIYDVCMSVLYSIESEFVRKHFSIRFLMEHVQCEQADIFPVSEHMLVIHFSQVYSETLVERMVDSLICGETLSKYIMHPVWKRKEIADRLSQMINESLSEVAKHNIFRYACFTGNKSIMNQLLPHCDINSRDLNGWTPAMYAVASGQKDCLKFLVKGKADLNKCGDNSNTLLHVASDYGSTSVAKYLLKDHNFDINNRGIHGWTPLACAICAVNWDVLELFFKCEALRDTTRKNALQLAFEWGNRSFVEKMLPKTEMNYRGNHGRTPIMCAVSSGKREIYDLLVSRNADIKLYDDDNNSLLHLACQAEDTTIVETLLSQLDINGPGQHGWTPVMKAAVNGRKDVYDLLMKENADLKMTDDYGNNLLHLACHGGNVSIVNKILPQFDINSRGGNGWTPVMYAVLGRHKIVFDLLVSNGADLSLKDDYSNSMFHLGCLGGNTVIVKDLLPKADLNSLGNLGRTGVMKAAWAGNADVFKFLVSKKADLQTLDENYDTILHLSSQGGNCYIVDFLIGKGFDINCRGKDDWTAVMNAAWSGMKYAFDRLSSSQESMLVYNACRDTILHLACEGGNISIVRTLLEALDVNIRGKNGRTPVMAAALAGSYEVFELLVSEKADLTLTDDYSNNILHLACRGGNKLIIEYLLPLELCDIAVPGENGFTPLIMAALSGKKEAYDLLAKREAVKPLLTSKGDNVLHAACQGGNIAIVKEVIDRFEINVRGGNGQTPLMRAVCGGHIAVYKYLVSLGADHTLVDKDGHTLLHLASRHGQLAVLKHKIDESDVNTKDNMGLTPAMTAVLHGKAAVLKNLKHKGTDLSLVDNTGDDALILAVKLGSRQIMKELDKKHNQKVTPWTELMKSLVRGEHRFLRTYSQQSPVLVQKDQTGDTLLHLACRGGNTQSVEYLLSSYNIDLQGRHNWTPVMMAAACGHADVFKLLVDKKAGLYHVSDTGEEILSLARRAKNEEIITYLKSSKHE